MIAALALALLSSSAAVADETDATSADVALPDPAVPSAVESPDDDEATAGTENGDVDSGNGPQELVRSYVPSPASEKLIRAGLSVKAELLAIEAPCRRFSALRCVERPLDAWNAALDDVERVIQAAGDGEGEDAHVVVFGNSLIASDRITDIVRARLQERFGVGGGSFYLTDRLADYGGRWRTGKSDRRWDIYNFSQGKKGRYAFGVPGAHHVSQRRGSKTRWRIEGDRIARVFWLDHARSPGFTLSIDGEKVRDVVAAHTGNLAITEIELPEGAKSLDLIAGGSRLVLHGVEMDAPRAGVRFDTHGIVAADSRKWMSADAVQFETELAARDPQLVIIMLGGNEVRRVAWKRYNLAFVEAQTAKFIERLQHVLPGASCLVVGPLHAVQGKDHSRPFQTRAELAPVNRIYRRQALVHGCAFFDTYRAMGGDGSLRRFHNKRMLHADYVHPRADGLNFLGEFIVQGIFRAWEKTPRPQAMDLDQRRHAEALTPNLIAGETIPLSAVHHEATFLEALHALENQKRKRVAVGVVGRGAGDEFAREIRNALSARFGSRGEGILSDVAEGTLVGQAIVTSPSAATYGIAGGLDGNRVHLEKEATYSLALPPLEKEVRSEGDDAPEMTASTQILWRSGPRIRLAAGPRAKASVGRGKVIFDDSAPAMFFGGVHEASIVAPLSSEKLRVQAPRSGMVDILIIARERDSTGVVVDDLTALTVTRLLRLHPQVVAGQTAARRWDLLLFAPEAKDLEPPATEGLSLFEDPANSFGAAQALEALQQGVPGAHCVVFGPQGPQGLFADVDKRAHALATAAGCGFFSTRTAVGDGVDWIRDGLWSVDEGATVQGRKRLRDAFLNTLVTRLDESMLKLAAREVHAEEQR